MMSHAQNRWPTAIKAPKERVPSWPGSTAAALVFQMLLKGSPMCSKLGSLIWKWLMHLEWGL